MDQAGSKGDYNPGLDQPDTKKLELSFQNLRKALSSESASNARQASGEVKARQDKAAAIIQGLK